MLTDSLKYSIFDPTGNITALIESTGSYGSIQAAAERIMEQHPEVEQAGLVRFDPEDPGAQAELLMAGGEFCGNASMCAAALYFLKNNKEAPEGAEATVSLRVSGARRKVLVKLQKESDKSFRAAVLMPEATGISEEEFIFEGVTGMLPVVTKLKKLLSPSWPKLKSAKFTPAL